MKRSVIVSAALIALASPAFARGGGSSSSGGSHSVSGYTTSRGTYVAPSHATNPNSTKLDNYSTKGNVNPYTGAVGTKNP